MPTETVYVNSYNEIVRQWMESGLAPWLGNNNDNIYINLDEYLHAEFGFANPVHTSDTLVSVVAYFEVNGPSARNDEFVPSIFDGAWQELSPIDPDIDDYFWYSQDISSILDTWTKITNAKLRCRYNRSGSPSTQTIYVRRAYLLITYTEVVEDCIPQTDSRIGNASVSWQGVCDIDIVDWDKANEFILATWATGGNDANKNFKLQWKESGGSFADVGVDTEICWGTGTSLVDGNNVGTTSGCLSSTVSEENEGDNAAVLDTMGSSDIGEIEWALGFGSGAQEGVTYEFQLVNISDTLTEVCSCSITTFSAAAYSGKGIDRGINRGIL